MAIRRPPIGLLAAVSLTALVLAGCTLTSFLGSASQPTEPTMGAAPTHAAATPPGETATAAPIGDAPRPPTSTAKPGKPGTVICGPVTVTQTIPICVEAGQEPLVTAAEAILTNAELASVTGAKVDQSSTMCSGVPPADCAGTPPLALVSFERGAGASAIRVLVKRTSDGGMIGQRL